MRNKIFKLLIILIILYLFISSIYILIYIDFDFKPQITGMGFSENKNIVRIIMGLPKMYSTYEGVSPIYIIEAIFKTFIGIMLCRYLYKNYR